MPFKSAKQRRFLYKNHPDIAKRWARHSTRKSSRKSSR